MELNLNIEKFVELADEAENESRSPLYRELDKVFLTLAELILERKIQRKQIVKMLIQSGIEEGMIDEAKFNAYWTAKSTKEKIADYQAQLDEKERKKQQRHDEVRDADSILANKEKNIAPTPSKLSEKQEPVVDTQKTSPVSATSILQDAKQQPASQSARHRRATIPSSGSKPKVSEQKAENKIVGDVIPGDLLIPWASFLNKANEFAELDSTAISNALQKMGIVERMPNRSYVLKKECEHFFPQAKVGQAIQFGALSVFGETLLKGIQDFNKPGGTI